MSDEPTLFEYLTQDEWKTCFALAFLADTAEYGPTVNLRPYHVLGGYDDTWESSIIAAVRLLALEHGFDFEAVFVREEDMEILAVQREPLCPENRVYLHSLGVGKLPDIPLAMKTAVRLLEERAPNFSTEPMREALAEIEDARRRVLQTTDGDELEQTRRFIDAALAQLGVRRETYSN